MRHVPGFDQGWRGYERQDKDPGSSIKNVEDDRQKTKKEHIAMRWRSYERQDKHPGSIKTLDPRLRMSGTSVEDDSKEGQKGKDSGSPIRSGITDKDKERTQRHEMARLQKTRQRPGSLIRSRMTEKGKALYLPSPLLTKEGKRKGAHRSLP